jgi:hypothetical protein
MFLPKYPFFPSEIILFCLQPFLKHLFWLLQDTSEDSILNFSLFRYMFHLHTSRVKHRNKVADLDFPRGAAVRYIDTVLLIREAFLKMNLVPAAIRLDPDNHSQKAVVVDYSV